MLIQTLTYKINLVATSNIRTWSIRPRNGSYTSFMFDHMYLSTSQHHHDNLIDHFRLRTISDDPLPTIILAKAEL